MDCVRTVLRMGAEQSIMTYRRSIQEIPVDALELEEAELEGVEIMFMVSPTRVIDDGKGQVAGIELIRNELGAPDDKGRRRPEPVAGSEFVIPCDMVLVAIGQRQDNRLLDGVEVQTDRRGVPVLNENLKTELPNVWAAGDYVVNPTNFISSIGEGKRVADVHRRGPARRSDPKVKEMEITRVPTEFISTPNPLLSEGIAEWTLSAMSRRLVWGDNYTSVGRQMMPAHAAGGPGSRHWATRRSKPRSATRSRSASKKPSAACNASSISSSTATAAFSAPTASTSARRSASRWSRPIAFTRSTATSSWPKWRAPKWVPGPR